MKFPSLFEIFKTQSTKDLVQKSSNITTVQLDQMINGNGFLDSVFWSPTSIIEAVLFYAQLQPVFDAVDRIVTEFASIKPRVFDTVNKEFVEDHPILDLLQQPNPFNTCDLFLKTLATDFLVTGNAFFWATGPVIAKPLELFSIRPQSVSVMTSGAVKVDSYRVSDLEIQDIYQLTNVHNDFGLQASERLGEFRYYHQDVKELFHFRDVNRLDRIQTNRHFGMNRLTPLFLEVDQYRQSSTHNLSILKRAGRSSGILISENPLTDNTRERLQKQMNDLYSGAENAGRMMLVDGAMKFEDLMKSNRDMDFLELKKGNITAIYNTYRVPLPLVLAEQMTLANMASATLSLYEGAVIPMTKFLYNQLTKALMPRYEDSENLVLAFDVFDIPALEKKRVQTAAEIAKVGVLTVNEIRTLLGKEGLENGDQIFLPANLLPLLSDLFTDDNLTQPRPSSSKSKFKSILKSQNDTDGQRVYSNENIADLASKIYGK